MGAETVSTHFYPTPVEAVCLRPPPALQFQPEISTLLTGKFLDRAEWGWCHDMCASTSLPCSSSALLREPGPSLWDCLAWGRLGVHTSYPQGAQPPGSTGDAPPSHVCMVFTRCWQSSHWMSKKRNMFRWLQDFTGQFIANWASLLQREQMGAFCLCVVCFAGRCHRSFFWESRLQRIPE